MDTTLSRRSLFAAGAMAGTMALASRASAVTPVADTPPLFGPAAGVAQLGLNENPYGPAPSAIRAIDETASKGCYYVRNGVTRLTAMIAEKHGVKPSQIVIGNGSTEILNAIGLIWKDKGPVLCPELFWDTTAMFAVAKGGSLKRVAMTPDMDADLDGLAAALTPDVGMVQICNPNNPTGVTLDGDKLRAFVRKVGATKTILVDEAYNELTEKPNYTSVAALVNEVPNLIICRTFSKIYGMAGLRVGYSISSEANAALIQSYLTGGGVNAAGIAGAIASYNDTAFTTFSLNRVVEARGIIMEAAQKAGLKYLPSQTNFVFVEVPDANALQSKMASRGIMIRGAYGKWKTWSRVSTGKIEDVKRYAAALPELVRA